jgi:hypothetical protein
MTDKAHISPKLDPTNRRWAVEFREVRTRTPEQERAIGTLDPGVLAHVLEIWLKVITPGAYIVEPHSATPWMIIFPNRAASRKFRSCFGGKLKPSSPR